MRHCVIAVQGERHRLATAGLFRVLHGACPEKRRPDARRHSLFYEAVASAAPNQPQTKIHVAYYIKKEILRVTCPDKKGVHKMR